MADGIIKLPTTAKPPKLPSKDELEKRTWCHRLYVPVSVAMQRDVPGIGPNIETKTDVSLMKCMHELCSIWSIKHAKCADLLNAESSAKLAELAETKTQEAKLLDVTAG